MGVFGDEAILSITVKRSKALLAIVI